MNGSPELQLNRDFLRLAAGDREAVSVVFQALWPSVHRFSRRYLNCDADADDAAQRAIEKLFEQAPNYDSTRSVLAWALTLALYECRTIRRQNSRRKVDPLVTELASEERSPEQALEQAQLSAALNDAIGQLSVADQETFSLILVGEGFGTFEADSRFRKRKQRAVTRLKEMWKKLYDS